MILPIKLWLADLVLWLNALYWCWKVEWKYAFAGFGAFAIIYLTKSLINLIGVYRAMKKMDEEIRKHFEE